MTRSTTPLALATGLTALCLGFALAVAVQHAAWPSASGAWTAFEHFCVALASSAEVALDRLLDGDPGGALRAFGALVRG